MVRFENLLRKAVRNWLRLFMRSINLGYQMARSGSLADKYRELIDTGVISPNSFNQSLEMPSARIYVPTFVSNSSGAYDHVELKGGEVGELDGHTKRVTKS